LHCIPPDASKSGNYSVHVPYRRDGALRFYTDIYFIAASAATSPYKRTSSVALSPSGVTLVQMITRLHCGPCLAENLLAWRAFFTMKGA
jgi:hypothetical protein